MSASLRERLLALVTERRAMMPFTEYVAQAIALAAARLALEDAEFIAQTGFDRADNDDEITDAIRARASELAP